MSESSARCPSCGVVLPDDARFCLKCGHALDPAALPTMTSPAVPLPNVRAAYPPVRGGSADGFDHGRFAPGTMLGDRYRIVARLGAGGMGEVFRADDLTLGQPVALKFLPEAVERDPKRLDNFIAEVRTARQVSHPNVCRVYDVGDVDGPPTPSTGSGQAGSAQRRRFLTMEYVDGEDLRSLLRRIGRLPEDKGIEIARQICGGLAAIHDRGILHRDLKPANIMLDGRGRVRLTDFGLATAVAGAGTDGEIAGTPAYMAPEQLAGRPLTTATDLYALGLVLFELFTGERVQKSDDAAVVRSAQRARTPDGAATTSSGAKLDPLVKRVIDRCLDPDPARRPQSAIVVAAALPGGDPLAAALAAGETPSPQMVAAAGGEGSLPFKVAVPLLLALIAGVVLTAWPSRLSYTALVPVPNSSDVLVSKANEMLARLGYPKPVVGEASGFFASSADYSDWLDQHDKSATRWQHVAGLRPPLLRFWHRTSPSPLVAGNFFGGTLGGGLAASFNDPPMTSAGMTYLELDPAGRLVRLDAVVGDRLDPADAVTKPDWSALFREAGLDMTAFKPVAPEWVSRTASDASAAWVGSGADLTGAPLRVEAAAFRGSPVFFRLFAPWTRPPHPPAESSSAQASEWIVDVATLALPVGALLLALRNLRLGRTDTRGALRLGVATGVLMFAAAVLSSDVPAGEGSVFIPFMLASWAALAGLLSWTFYVAAEPYVRRGWPRMMIGWSRLLDGRWRDPLVGRDLLIGGVAGFALNQFILILRWRGVPPSLDAAVLGLNGTRPIVSYLIAVMPVDIWLALGIAVLLVVFRMVLRGERAAAIGLMVLLGVPAVLAVSGDVVEIMLMIVLVTTWVIVVTRYGLMMFAAMLLTFEAAGRFGDFSQPGFARGALLLGLACTIAPGVWGFFTATRGRKAGAWLDR